MRRLPRRIQVPSIWPNSARVRSAKEGQLPFMLMSRMPNRRRSRFWRHRFVLYHSYSSIRMLPKSLLSYTPHLKIWKPCNFGPKRTSVDGLSREHASGRSINIDTLSHLDWSSDCLRRSTRLSRQISRRH